MRKLVVSLVSFMLLGMVSPAFADASSDFQAVLDEHWQWTLDENPVLASSLDIAGYEGKLGDVSLEAQDRSAAKAAEFLARLKSIPADQLSEDDRTNRAVLISNLERQVEGNRFAQRTMLFTTYYGWHQDFAGLADNLPLRSVGDFESYIARLRQYPKINDTSIAISNEAIAQGYTLPCVVLDGYEKTISGVIAPDPTQSRFYAPFTKPKPNGISQTDWDRLAAETRETITTVLNPAYQKHLDWYLATYKPACAKVASVSAQKGGKAYYAYLVRAQTTTDLTPDEIHNIGLSEVARIRNEMEDVAKAAGYADRKAFIDELHHNPKYYATTAEELMRYAARQAKAIDGLMPGFFAKLPRLPYGVREIPAETAEGTTTAYYSPGSPDAGIAGNYYVNTSRLDQRPLWELPALTAHEAVPGHHNQIALQQELDLPPFRRFATNYTAYTEGWGLYSERLGIEMGLYDTPEKQMGRLSYEMWRACRLVVDTGVHAKGWTKAKAVAFMRENTALTDANIDAEVNRYISWPGQALGYKIGELKIRELRSRAEKALGDRFDLRQFHNAVLGTGAVPLDVLEQTIDRWIASQQQ